MKEHINLPPGTIKTFLDDSRAKQSSDSLGAEKDIYGDKFAEFMQFDHLPQILVAKNKKQGEIFLIDNDVEALKKLIKLIENTDTEELRIGVIFKVGGHSTPFCIEKIIEDSDVDDSDKEKMVIYNTDSVVMDIDSGDQIKEIVQNLLDVADEVYCLGYKDSDGSIVRDYKRQSDEYSCANYSLFDVETMIKDGFYKFATLNSTFDEKDGVYTIKALPPQYMATIQSIEGKVDPGAIVRKGLRAYTESNPVDAQQKIEINNQVMSLMDLLSQIQSAKIPNPVMTIMNQTNLKLYEDGANKKDGKSLFLLDINKLNDKEFTKDLRKKIFKLASQNYAHKTPDNQSSAPQYVGPLHPIRSTQDFVASSDHLNQSQAKVALIMVGVIAGLIFCLQIGKNRLNKKTQNDGDKASDKEVAQHQAPQPEKKWCKAIAADSGIEEPNINKGKTMLEREMLKRQNLKDNHLMR